MKRFAVHEDDMARVLMLMSSSQYGQQQQQQTLAAPRRRVFVCKTCNRAFPSFQALGGHRASHKKPRLDGDDLAALGNKPKLHGCTVCGLEFAIGQALGGHMRRHRAVPPPPAIGVDDKKPVVVHHDDVKQREEMNWLDLNHPPCDDDQGCDNDGHAAVECGYSAAAATVGITFHQFLDTGTAMAVDCLGY